ncbi:hypothetical protein GMSM_22740 [Geomonas sp. Red276]
MSKDSSIRSMIVAIMLGSGIPIFVVFCVFVFNQYLDKRHEAEQKVIAGVRAIAAEHVAEVEGMRSLMVALSQYPEIRLKDPAGCMKLLNLILTKSPSGLNVGVADIDGRVIATGVIQPLPIQYSVADRRYFKEALRTRKFVAGEFAVSRAVHKPTIHFALPVLNEKQQPILVLYAAQDLDGFAKSFDAQNFPYGSIVNLTDHRGTVLMRYSHLGLENQDGKPDHPDLRRHMTGTDDEGIFTGVGLDGARRHLAFKRLRLSPDAPPYLYIRVSIPEKIATATARRSLWISVAVFTLAAVLTTLLTRLFASRFIIRPLERIVHAAKLVEGGDLSARSGLLYTKDELGQLARSFDEMTLALDERIREISYAENEKHRLAYYDGLTGLPNRRLLQNRLDLALARSKRHDIGFALIYLDLDNFKHVNDSLGHAAGDQLLKVMAVRYLNILRDDDVVCRLGGDEFAIILHDVQRESTVMFVVEKLLMATGEPVQLEGQELLVTASIGVALYPKDAEDPMTLGKNADLALYHAKDAGRNTFRMFSEQLDRAFHERLSLIHALQHALEFDELSLVYQPKVCLQCGEVIGVEALLRWHSAVLGEVEPARFIPIAEETRQIVPIGEWVLKTACRQQVAWREMGTDLAMAVNISAAQFKSPALIETIKGILEETGIDPERLELELTESCLVERPDEATRILTKIRDLRCKIAIDDFGTGYSSLSYLKNFPVTVLKIDRSFVKDITRNPNNQAIAQSVVNLARNLSMLTVAEGVEEVAQREILKEMGCRYFQGFLHSRPMAPEEVLVVVTDSGLHDREEHEEGHAATGG